MAMNVLVYIEAMGHLYTVRMNHGKKYLWLYSRRQPNFKALVTETIVQAHTTYRMWAITESIDGLGTYLKLVLMALVEVMWETVFQILETVTDSFMLLEFWTLTFKFLALARWNLDKFLHLFVQDVTKDRNQQSERKLCSTLIIEGGCRFLLECPCILTFFRGVRSDHRI